MSGLDDLRTTLAELRNRIARASDRRLNEQNTKATLIEPLLRTLGWRTEDSEEVHREYKVQRRDKPVDYALLTVRTPRLFLEAKPLGENLDDRRWASQMMGYAAVAGVEWIVLSDGNEYRIYNAHASVPVDEKLFRAVRVTEDGPLVEETLGLLAKHRIEENRIEILWRAQFVDRQVKAAIERLFSAESDMVLVNYVGKNTTNLSASEIRASLGRCKVQLDFPPLDVEPVPPSTGKKQPRRPVMKEVESDNSSDRVKPADLIRSGTITPPLDIFSRYRGHELRARIETDGGVTYGGKRYPTLSAAGRAALTSLTGEARSRNGWTFWRFKDPAGGEHEVDVLRQRFLRERDGGAAPGSAAV